MATRPRGRLIVFEGAEGVGKTTQIRLLGEWLAACGFSFLAFVREPGGTPLGNEIRRLLLESEQDLVPRAEALLFMASRAQLVEREIRPALNAGTWVLADRFFLSTYAYQAAGRGIPEAEVVEANSFATQGLVPDLTLLFELPVAEGLARAGARGGHDRIERSGDEFHARVAEAFRTFATAAWQSRHPECGPIVTIDAVGSVTAVARRVAEAVSARWPETFARTPG
jgi:dTMP kinase